MSAPGGAASSLRRALPYLGIAVLVALSYDGWVFYARWSAARDAQRAEARKQAQEAQKTLELMGGDQLKILDFYATSSPIRRGQQTTICYGVNNADRVRIDPPVEQLHPALSRCIEVAPRRNTEYKLIAEDRSGHTATARLTVRVAP